jgi:hypothetical protein
MASLTEEMNSWHPPPKSTGQICYEGYAGALGWEHGGKAMPPWELLPLREQVAFEAGAHDVLRLGWQDAQPHPAGRHARHG